VSRRSAGRRVGGSGLDVETYQLAQIAALVAIDAPHVSWLRHLEAADEHEIELDKILGTLLAVAPVVGSAKIVAACAKIVRAAALGEEFGVLAEVELTASLPARRARDACDRDRRERASEDIDEQGARPGPLRERPFEDVHRVREVVALEVRVAEHYHRVLGRRPVLFEERQDRIRRVYREAGLVALQSSTKRCEGCGRLPGAGDLRSRRSSR